MSICCCLLRWSSLFSHMVTYLFYIFLLLRSFVCLFVHFSSLVVNQRDKNRNVNAFCDWKSLNDHNYELVHIPFNFDRYYSHTNNIGQWFFLQNAIEKVCTIVLLSDPRAARGCCCYSRYSRYYISSEKYLTII